MSAVWSYLMAGSPAHWLYAVLGVFVLLEYILGKTKAGSTLALVLGAVAKCLFQLLPAALQLTAEKLLAMAPGAKPPAPPAPPAAP